jgi:hypothetical protein
MFKEIQRGDIFEERVNYNSIFEKFKYFLWDLWKSPEISDDTPACGRQG